MPQLRRRSIPCCRACSAAASAWNSSPPPPMTAACRRHTLALAGRSTSWLERDDAGTTLLGTGRSSTSCSAWSAPPLPQSCWTNYERSRSASAYARLTPVAPDAQYGCAVLLTTRFGGERFGGDRQCLGTAAALGRDPRRSSAVARNRSDRRRERHKPNRQPGDLNYQVPPQPYFKVSHLRSTAVGRVRRTPGQINRRWSGSDAGTAPSWSALLAARRPAPITDAA